jgi:uncharacterized protein YndB with AHSA1/START domain
MVRSPLVITRTFEAARALVYQACTQQHMARWFDPKGLDLPHNVMD